MGGIAIPFAKEAAAPSNKIEIPLSREAAAPLGQVAVSFSERGGCSIK